MKKKSPNFIKNEGTLPQRGKLMDLVNEFDDEQLQENISAENRAETTLEILLQKIGQRQLLKCLTEGPKDQNAKPDEEGGEAYFSHDKEEPFREMNRA